jgi:hypothetical protein
MEAFGEYLFHEIADNLCHLTDRQLTNLVEVIRVEQKEREDDRIAAAVGC